jgi:hypothetical protein
LSAATIDLDPPLPGLSLRAAWKSLRAYLGFDRDPLKWRMAGEGATTLQYLGRLDHLRDPDPCEGEVLSGPNVCFLVRTYAGRREMLWVDTATAEVSPLAFFASYAGRREHYPDVVIGSPRQY